MWKNEEMLFGDPRSSINGGVFRVSEELLKKTLVLHRN
jgi:hypothetical protein